MTAINIFLFILGAIFGSFVNVLIYRLPKKLDFVRGRSFCPECRRTLRWFELIPLVSFVIQGGKCRYCRKPISRSYFIVEFSSGIFFFASYILFWSAGPAHWLFTLFLLELFLVLTMTDLKYLLLPDPLVFTGIGAAIIFGIAEKTGLITTTFDILSQPNLIGAIVFFSIFFAVWYLSKGRWMGLGDAKLGALVGLVFGFWGGIAIIYLAVILGALIAVGLLISKRADLKTKLPLGTFIGVMAIVHIFFNRDIMEMSEYVARFLTR